MRPSLRDRLLWGVLAAMLGACTPLESGIAHEAASVAEAGPRAVAGRFYSWYLGALAANRDPLRDDEATLARQVSAALMAEIRKKIASPDGLEADYFIQAQDYGEDWLHHIAVSPPKAVGAATQVDVDLGAAKATRQRLLVTLVQEGGAWKIRKVTARQR